MQFPLELPRTVDRRLSLAIGLGLLLWGSSALGQERYDHRGAVGLLVGTGLEHTQSAAGGRFLENGLRLDADLGLTVAVGHDGNELKAFGRASLGGSAVDWSMAAGYRGYFGDGRFKTFFDLDGAAHLAPAFVLGPRVGFGAQLELSPLVGLYAGLAAQLGFGAVLRFDAELVLGLQLRSYLLE